MRGSTTFDRPEALTRNVAKVLAAFVAGLVTVFGGALVYSHLQQSRESAAAAPLARREPSALSAEPLTPAMALAHSLPERSIRAQDRQPTSPSTAVAPEAAARNTIVGGPLAETRLPVQPRFLDGHGPENARSVPPQGPIQNPSAVSQVKGWSGASPVGGESSRLPFGQNSNAAPPPFSPLLPKSKDTPSPEQRNPSSELPPRAAAPQTWVEPAPSASTFQVVVIPATTTLAVRLSEALSSDHQQPGDIFRATLVSPLMVNNYVLAETGATVWGRVETSRRAPLLGGRSELSVSLTEIGTWDGQRTRVETGWRQVKGTRNPLTRTAKIASGAAVGAVAGAMNGAAEGAGVARSAFAEGPAGSGWRAEPRTAALPAGAQLTFILVAPLTGTGRQQR